MPAPNPPNDFKNAIPSASGSFCEKFLSVFRLPQLVYNLVAYIWNEDGSFTDAFKTDICALGCKTGADGGFPVPIVSATDGQFADKIQILWTVVAGSTSYDLYRNTINSPTTSSLLAAGLTVNTYDDTTVVANNLYFYWVKAKNATQSSGYGQGDSGYAGALSTELAMITDLRASHGISEGPGGVIQLVWSKVSGADSYNIYRAETDQVNSAIVLELNAVPKVFNPLDPPYSNINDNGDEISYLHFPGSANGYKKYYFWVVPKRSLSAPPAQGPVSNADVGADGWATGDGSGVVPSGGSNGLIQSGAFDAFRGVFAGGYTRIWFAVIGCGAGGAGGGLTRGGGGGGAPAIIVGNYTLPSASAGVSKFRVTTTPEANAGGGAGEANGTDGGVTVFEYSPLGDFSDTIAIATCAAPGKGLYNASADGAGGAGASGSVDAGVSASLIYDGQAGESANGSTGGRSGYSFGDPSNAPAHFNNFSVANSYAGDGIGAGGAGSGSMASPNGAALATGGDGRRGAVYFAGY